MPDLIKSIKEIPEKSKEVFKKIENDWKYLSAPEKIGVVALAVLFSPIVVPPLATFFRHLEEDIARYKKEEAMK